MRGSQTIMIGIIIYTPKKMFLLGFSFAKFETTTGSRGKAKISFLLTTLPKKITPQFSKFANEKARINIIWGV